VLVDFFADEAAADYGGGWFAHFSGLCPGALTLRQVRADIYAVHALP
jgi:hypothetical protein